MKQGWEEKKLGEVCDFQGGSQPPKSNFIYEQREGYVRFLQIRDFGSDKNITYIPESKKNKYCNQDDILLGRYGASVGKILVNKTGAYNVAVMKTIPNEKILNKRYLFFYLTSSEFQVRLSKVASRSAQDGFSKDDIFDFPILIPSIAEQQLIVAILDEAFAAIAKAKANAEQNLKNAKELFESYLQEVFENKGEDWEEKRLGELSERVSVGHVGPTSEFYCDQNIGVPFIRSQNVRSGYLDWKGIQYITKDFHQKLKKSQLKIGDILFVRVGANRGDCCILKENIKELNCANIVFARLKEGNVDFIDMFCQSPMGKKQLLGMSVGAAQGVINTKSVAELIIPYPPLKEQQNIVQRLDTLSKETKKLEVIYKQKINDLEELKNSVLQKAFSGELKTEKILV